MKFTYHITDKVLAALKLKAERANTTPDALLNQRLDSFCERCVCEYTQDHRNNVINKIVDLKPGQLQHVEQVIDKLLREVAG